MRDLKKHQPIYKDFIHGIQKGFLLLDEKSQHKVKEFIRSQQDNSGAFINRGGKPDLYYSLFGCWISDAINLNEQKIKLLDYAERAILDENKLVDRYALLLIRLALKEKQIHKPNSFFFLKTFFNSNQQLNPAYRAFLFLLSFDAFYGHRKLLYFLLKAFLKYYRVPDEVPCSFRAAWLMAKQIVGLDVKDDSQLLFDYYEKGSGFKSFQDADSADLLSTAVALFALKKAGTELRKITPDMLEFVQQNFDKGAFLAGNGDQTRDLEYTFYGLLILGTLS